MSIEISANGVTKSFQRYPDDALYVNGQQVKEVWVNGVKCYPEGNVETEMDIYEQDYFLDYAAASSDGRVYAVTYYSTSSMRGVQIPNCTVSGKMRYFVPKNVSMDDCDSLSTMLKAECYRHNSYTVTCDIPDELRSLYGGLENDICDQLKSGYTFDDYARRAKNGIVSIKTIEGSRSFFDSDYSFGSAMGSLIGEYNDNSHHLNIRNRRSGYGGYNDQIWYIYRSFPIDYLGTGAPDDYITAKGLFQ